MDKKVAYKRILQILDDYWMSQPNEEEIFIHMYFKHHNGDKQFKDIIWRNPKFSKNGECYKESLPERKLKDYLD